MMIYTHMFIDGILKEIPKQNNKKNYSCNQTLKFDLSSKVFLLKERTTIDNDWHDTKH